MPHPQARSGRCPDGEKTEEKAGEATAEEERGGKRPRVEGLQLEVEAQIELKITDGAAGSRLKIEKVVQKLVEERLRVLELTVFDRTLQELKERVEKIDCATKHQGTLNTLQARIARLVKKFGAANQASENSRKVQEELKKTPLAPQVNTAATTGITNGIRALHPNGGAGGVVSVTTACAPTQSAAAVVGVATSSSANPASSLPAVTGAAAPATPSASAMTSKTDNQASSSTAVKAAAQTVVKCPPASSLRQGTAVYLVTKKPMLLCDDKGWMANMESRLAARTADLTSERTRAAQLLAENASLKADLLASRVETDNLRQELQGLRETSQMGGSAGIGEPHSALHSTAPEFDSSVLLDYQMSLTNSIRMTGQRPDVSLRHFGPEDHVRLHTLSFGQVGRYGCLLFRHIISEENYKAWSKTTNWDGSRGKRALPQNVRTFVVATLKRHFPDMDRGELKECIDKINEFLRTTRKNS
ncbi:activating transcription factor 7-interacting protein 1-like isoform X1 [Alosa alosa]|uniref:activating transcription factor 7-interacting protein 1-like isoform X1 n=1 Tax=Alosa alosa TaxID=278164 RepID=UPI0020151523|nr:activating transcription factor 7-interacting protein 1-like isoform X1 [Alosa alosa]